MMVTLRKSDFFLDEDGTAVIYASKLPVHPSEFTMETVFVIEGLHPGDDDEIAEALHAGRMAVEVDNEKMN